MCQKKKVENWFWFKVFPWIWWYPFNTPFNKLLWNCTLKNYQLHEKKTRGAYFVTGVCGDWRHWQHIFCCTAQWQFSVGKMTSSSPVACAPSNTYRSVTRSTCSSLLLPWVPSHTSPSRNHRVNVLTWKCTQCAGVCCEGLMKTQRFHLSETLSAHSCTLTVCVCECVSHARVCSKCESVRDLRPLEVVHCLKWLSC